MARKTLKYALMTAGVCAALAGPAAYKAWAAYPVIDSTAIAQLTKQLSELKKQIKELKEIRDLAQDQIDAIGEVGQIAVPIVNAAKLASSLSSGSSCLLPDFSRLMPSVDFENVDFGSICEAGNAYRESLWLDPEEVAKLPWKKQEQLRRAVQKIRQNILVDAAAKGLGTADIAQKMAQDANMAADEIEAAANTATDSNTRLTVATQAQAMAIRVQAQTNQILAQQLKVQSALAAALGVKSESPLAKKEGDEDGNKEGSDG